MLVILRDLILDLPWRPKYLIFLSFGSEEFATCGRTEDSNRKEDYGLIGQLFDKDRGAGGGGSLLWARCVCRRAGEG
jgi:hypothetical protein